MHYIVIIILTLFWAYLYEAITRKGSNTSLKIGRKTVSRPFNIGQIVSFCLMILPPILTAGLRYGISTDYLPVYVRGFYRVSTEGNGTDKFEPAFHALIELCATIGAGPWLMFFLTSAITLGFLFYSFNYSQYYTFSVALLFFQGIYFDTFNGIRQYVVVAVFLYCLKYIKKGDWRRYMLIMGSCVLMHTSALITLPLYFLRKIKINHLFLFIPFTIIILFKEYLHEAFIFVLSLNPKYYINFIAKDIISSYIIPSTSQFVLSFIALVPMIYVYHKMIATKEGLFFINMAFLNLAFAVMSLFIPLMERVLYYSKAWFLLSIPYACSLIRDKRIRYLLIIFELTMIGTMNLYGIFHNNWYAVLPYRSIFFQ